MLARTECPSRQHLESYFLGRLSEEDSSGLGSHLEVCANCLEVVQTFRCEDTLLSAIRTPPETPINPEIDLEELTRRLRLLCLDVQSPETTTQIESEAKAGDQGKETGTEGILEFLSPAETEEELGRIGSYRILQMLGRGGMGVVLLAEDPKLKRQVALKVMLPQLAKSKQARERFLREAQAAAALEHDHIVPILAVGEEHDVPFIVMPYLRGESLDTRLKQPEPLPMSAILQIATQATEALIVAHEHGFIHRDIKPANIWLERKDDARRVKEEKASGALSSSSLSHSPTAFRVKLLDFGLARLAVHDDQHLTQTGAMLGTPGYMAPEQANGEKVDGRADIFSLGCVLYRLATGKVAFPGDNMMARIKSLALHDPTPPRELNPAMSVELSALIQGMMTKDPSARPTAAEAFDQLQALPCNTPTPPVPQRNEAGSEVEQNPAPKEKNPREELSSYSPRPSCPDLSDGEAAIKKSSRRAVWLMSALLLFAPLAWYAVTVVLRVETENGTLIVQINDDAVEARIKNGKLILTGPDGIGPYTLAPHERNKLLPTGPYKIRVEGANGLSLDTEEFTIRKGDTVTVRVTLATKQNDPLPATYKNSLGMEFVKVGQGTAWLGGGNGKPGEIKVEIPYDFYLGRYEVTQEQWTKVTGQNPSGFPAAEVKNDKGKSGVQDDPHGSNQLPVEKISGVAAKAFVERLNKREKESGWVYRLPTVNEWDYACRGGPQSDRIDSSFDFYFEKPTNTLPPELANFGREKGRARTSKVGSYPANCLGLFDMHGNVWEWCDDTINGNDGALYQALQGGSWYDDAGACRAGNRHRSSPSFDFNTLGLRVARVPAAWVDPSKPPIDQPTYGK